MRTVRAIEQFAQENLTMGSRRYLEWLDTETELRQKIAALINAASYNDIALVKNTSEALSIVAYGIAWTSGDNIVITDREFPFNHVVWESLADQGVELRIADTEFASNNDPEGNILKCCDHNTRLISVSSIQYSTGLKLNLQRIGKFCQQEEILFCIDAIQSVGAVPFDVQACHADFVMADGHKWMLAPEGLGFFYCRPELINTIKLRQYGWHMLENMGDYDNTQWEIAHTARRFECGSPNLLGVHALNASVSLLLETGIEEVGRCIKDNIQYALQIIQDQPALQLLSPETDDRLGGIIVFQHRDKNSGTLYKSLQQQKVLCALRGGGIRFSPHFYTPKDKIHQAFELVLQ